MITSSAAYNKVTFYSYNNSWVVSLNSNTAEPAVSECRQQQTIKHYSRHMPAITHNVEDEALNWLKTTVTTALVKLMKWYNLRGNNNCQKDHADLKLRDESLGISQLALGSFTFTFQLRQLLLQTVNAGLLLCVHLSEPWLFSCWTLQLTLHVFHLIHMCCHGGFCTSMLSCQL